MFVCICNAVKESQIKQAIVSGHDTLEALQQILDVATCCGGCQPMIEQYLDEHLEQPRCNAQLVNHQHSNQTTLVSYFNPAASRTTAVA